MMFGLVTMVHLADTKEQLDSDTETILTTARKHLCQMSVLRWQQKDGLDTVLPYDLRKIQALRTLTTESTAVLIPFWAQKIMQAGSIYYGQNTVSNEHDCGRPEETLKRKQLPPQYPSVPADDHQAGRSAAGGGGG